jgi:hypothetical protein
MRCDQDPLGTILALNPGMPRPWMIRSAIKKLQRAPPFQISSTDCSSRREALWCGDRNVYR